MHDFCGVCLHEKVADSALCAGAILRCLNINADAPTEDSLRLTVDICRLDLIENPVPEHGVNVVMEPERSAGLPHCQPLLHQTRWSDAIHRRQVTGLELRTGLDVTCELFAGR